MGKGRGVKVAVQISLKGLSTRRPKFSMKIITNKHLEKDYVETPKKAPRGGGARRWEPRGRGRGFLEILSQAITAIAFKTNARSQKRAEKSVS